MKRNNIKKAVFAFLLTSMLASCEPGSEAKSSAILSSNESSINSSVPESSLPIESSSTDANDPTKDPNSDSYILKNDNKTCAEHTDLEETIVRKASIIRKGIKGFTCPNCHGYHEEYYYDLDEVAFPGGTFAYDGHERSIYIEGMIPYGCTVEYENNTLTEKGTKAAKAKIYNEDHQLIETLEAAINIVDNHGFANVKVTTEDGAVPTNKKDYVTMNLSTDNCDDSYKLTNKAGGIRLRGNSTNQSTVTKKAYRIKFDKKQAMLGLNDGMSAKSWVLLADFFDQSMFRNNVAFTFGNSLFNYSENYCTDFQHVNFYLNDQYMGVYTLAEQQQANKNRVNVAEPEEKDGVQNTDEKVGYLLEVEGMGQADSEDITFRTGDGTGGGNQWGGWGGFGGGGEQINGVGVEDKEYNIKTDTFGDKQLPYIKKYLSNIFKIFKETIKTGKLQVLDENHDIIDSPYKTMYETLNSFMDIESLMKTYVIQEIMKNYDVGWASFYLFVDFSEGSKYPRLTFGAPWDFDWSSANPNRSSIIDPTGNYNGNGTQPPFSNPWLYLLSQTDFFNAQFAKYWSVFHNSGCYQSAVEYMNYETSAFASEFAHNYEVCDNLHGSQACRMYTRFDVVEQFQTHADAVEVLKTWLASRIAYLDSTWLK
jgi:hypothetical protein